ncbi:hypothetical protein PHMEG_0005137 [Phytophthora megakarya]|uniref:Uncharacterized protein n=1 Tax=Phytophthora megakarya TaxID=4795 RepID=A0A225WRZ4_9STRA|nr:hypothetical protein PHMEG_0005137 [Phytophthora megakarya]
MHSSPSSTPLDAWKATVVSLFGTGFKSVKSRKKRYPKLKGNDAIQLFEFSTWYAFKEAGHMRNGSNIVLNKVKWAKSSALTQWSTVVQQGTAQRQTQGSVAEDSAYPTFMFNPQGFQRRTLNGSPDLSEKWVTKGNTATTRGYNRRVENRAFPLLSTIQAHVEGELMVMLNGCTTSERNLQELHALISHTKTIGYSKATKSIHFFFFDRASAAKYAMTIVPFKRRVYRLSRPDGQSGSDSPERDPRAPDYRTEYSVRFHNVSRFVDFSRLTAFFKKHSAVDFDLEGREKCTPESRSSTIWKVTFKLAACPGFLRGIGFNTQK